ncbi:MAG: B12-binding domain-containing radical SAM protein [Candidatus Nanoarchaeia archaeon]
MKIALVVPGGKKEMEGMKQVARPPLGVCYLKSYLEQNGHKAKVFHQIDESDSELVKSILEYNPNLTGFSTMSCVFDEGSKLAKMLKQYNPNIKTVFGGEHITGCFAEDQKYEKGFFEMSCVKDGIDYFIPFEGEIPLLNLVSGLESKTNEREIKGILFNNNNNGKWEYTGQVPRIKNLDMLPAPDRSDLPYNKYCSVDEASNLEYMHTGRGCRFRCSYCATPVSSPGKVVANSAERVLEEIQERYKAGHDTFFFADELFTFDPQRVEEICKGIERIGLKGKIKYRVFARVDDVSKGKINLELLKNSGCNGLFFGVESMNQETLNRLKKGTTPSMIEDAINKTYNAGIPVWASLMLGFPWETENQLRESLNKYVNISRGKVFHTYSSFLTPFPGTDFHNYCRINNLIINSNYLRSDCSSPVLKTPIISEKLIEIHKEFREAIK